MVVLRKSSCARESAERASPIESPACSSASRAERSRSSAWSRSSREAIPCSTSAFCRLSCSSALDSSTWLRRCCAVAICSADAARSRSAEKAYFSSSRNGCPAFTSCPSTTKSLEILAMTCAEMLTLMRGSTWPVAFTTCEISRRAAGSA